MIQNRLEIKIDFRHKKSLNEQIFNQLIRQIREERIGAGERLPTVRELADRLSVNFNTVARVYRQLDRQGLISTQHGRGTYVLAREEPAEEKDAFSEESFLERLDTFLQTESERYGKSPAQLWACIWDQEETTQLANRRKYKFYSKITHKPGWQTRSSRFPTKEKKRHRQRRAARPTITRQN